MLQEISTKNPQGDVSLNILIDDVTGIIYTDGIPQLPSQNLPLTAINTPGGGGGGSPTGPAGGDLGGTYPNPTVTGLSHVTNSSLPNSGLVHNSVTINSQNVALGGSITIPLGIQSATVTLTASQVNNLVNTPITLVAAAGAGTFIEIDNLTVQYKFGSIPFVVIGGSGFEFLYGSFDTGESIAATGLIDQTSSQLWIDGPIPLGQTIAQASLANQPFVVSNSSSNFTGGTGGTVTFFVLYRVITLT